MKYNLINQLKTWKNNIVGLDIETITIKVEEDEWKIVPFELGLYNPSKKQGIRIFINPFYNIHISGKKEGIIRFYKPEKYLNMEGYLLNLLQVREIFNQVSFKKVYGHNLLAFDIPHLKNNGVNIRAKDFFDTYLMAGNCLPLRYYLKLLRFNELVKNDEENKFKFFTEKGNLKFTAEAIYCYLSDNPHFKESHTAVEDCIIEYELYKYMVKNQRKDAAMASNWLNNIMFYFKKFKKTQKVFNELIEKYNRIIDRDCYTKKVLNNWGIKW